MHLSVPCGPGHFTSWIRSSKAVPRARGQVRPFGHCGLPWPLCDGALFCLRLVSLCGSASAPVPCETGTQWPGAWSPLPQVQGETVLFLGTCRWLPALPEHPGPWPRMVARKGSAALRDSTPVSSRALVSAWKHSSVCSFLVPPWGHTRAPFWRPWGFRLAASPAAFGPQSWPPRFLGGPCPCHGWGLTSCGSPQRSYVDNVSFCLHSRLGSEVPSAHCADEKVEVPQGSVTLSGSLKRSQGQMLGRRPVSLGSFLDLPAV